MKEWTELYRDMLSAYNALAEAIATAKTLHERDTRRIAELEAELAAERDELLARAEAAEADADLRATERDSAIDRALSVEMQLEAAKTELKSTHDFYDLAIGVAQAHEARIDELKAQLTALKAAGEWRPVTDDDPTPLQRVVIETNDGTDVGWRLPEMPHYWITRRGRSYLTEKIHGFKKLPPPQE